MKNRNIIVCIFTAGLMFCATHLYGSYNLIGSTDLSNPTRLSSSGADTDYVWKGSGTNLGANWADFYLAVDRTSIASWAASANGGYHTNVHFMFNSVSYGVNSLTSGFQEMFQYNIVGISAGYYFEAAAGTTATITNTNTSGMTINLASIDCATGGDPVYGLKGRTFSVGEGVTLSAVGFGISGKLSTSASSYTDSIFILSGTMNGTSATSGATFSNTNVNITSTGVLNGTGSINFNGTTTANVSGTINVGSNAGAALNIGGTGGNFNLLSGGKIYSAKDILLNGGNVSLAGTVSKSDGSAANLVTYAGTTNLSVSGSGVKIGVFTLNSAANLKTDVSAASLYTTAGYTVGMSVDAGKTLSVKKVVSRANATFSGNITVNYDSSDANSSFMVAAGTATLDGANVVSTASDDNGVSLVYGTLNVNNSSVLTSKKSLTVFAGGVVNINSGTVTAGDSSATAASQRFINGGTVYVNSGGALVVYNTRGNFGGGEESGNLIVDGGYIGNISKTNNGTYAFVAKAGKTLEVKNYGVVNAASYSSDMLGIAGGTITTDATAEIQAYAIAFENATGGTLNLGGDQVLSWTPTKIMVIRSGSNTINLAGAGDYLFDALQYHGTGNGLTIELNGSKIDFSSIGGLGTTTETSGTLILKDFVAQSVKFENLDGSMLASDGTITVGTNVVLHLSAYGVDGNLLGGNWSIDDLGYVFNSALVPEPAELAAVLGALALAYSLRRRLASKRVRG